MKKTMIAAAIIGATFAFNAIAQEAAAPTLADTAAAAKADVKGARDHAKKDWKAGKKTTADQKSAMKEKWGDKKAGFKDMTDEEKAEMKQKWADKKAEMENMTDEEKAAMKEKMDAKRAEVQDQAANAEQQANGAATDAAANVNAAAADAAAAAQPAPAPAPEKKGFWSRMLGK
ncbi:MAG: hypothetical protein FWC61_03860 [Proteobacteria bacterium]|nr:hypothetical protein [Pseudomonadota bacterium]